MAALCRSGGLEVSALSSGHMHPHKNIANDSESRPASAATKRYTEHAASLLTMQLNA
jgi:hypothetical protein